MEDRGVIQGGQDPPPSPPPPATYETSLGGQPWQTDAAAPANTMINSGLLPGTIQGMHNL